MKKFVDNNYGKDMINTYRGLLFSNLERSRAKDIEDVEAMNFVPQAAYGLSFNPLEYGIIPEAKNDTGIKFGDVINGAVGTQMSRYFQYSPKYEQTKIKFQPGKGKTIREKSAPMGYAYSREILDPWGGNYMFETKSQSKEIKLPEQTENMQFNNNDYFYDTNNFWSTPNQNATVDFWNNNQYACGGLKKYDGVNGSSTVNRSNNTYKKHLLYEKNGYRFYDDGTIAKPYKTIIGTTEYKTIGNYKSMGKTIEDVYKHFGDNDIVDFQNTNIYNQNVPQYITDSSKPVSEFDFNNKWFSAEQQAKIEEDAKDAGVVDETKPKQDVTGTTGIGNSTGAGNGTTATTGTASSTSTTGTETTESNASATNTPATNTPTTGTTTTPSQQVVTDTKLPLGYAAFNYGNRLWGSYNKDAVLDNDRLLRYDAGDNGIHIRYQRIPRKEWKNRNNNANISTTNPEFKIDKELIENLPVRDWRAPVKQVGTIDVTEQEPNFYKWQPKIVPARGIRAEINKVSPLATQQVEPIFRDVNVGVNEDLKNTIEQINNDRIEKRNNIIRDAYHFYNDAKPVTYQYEAPMLSQDYFMKCGGKKMALGGPDYMNVDTELTDVVNEDVINRNLNKAFINGQWVDLTDQSTVRDAKIAQPRRDNWWATDMAVYDGAKLLGNMYDAIQQNKLRNKVRSLDDIAFTNYGDANPAYNYGNFDINGNPVGLDNYRNLVKSYHQSAFGGKFKCGGKYQNGGVYDLTPDEIREIYANGGRVEFLD